MEARDGVRIFVESSLPHYTARQRWPAEDSKGSVQMMKNKLRKVIGRRYLTPGYVKSLTNYFAVPKGLQDIRMVYDGTKSRLNAAVWAPNFFLPSIDSLTMFCDGKTWFADIDLGEMFLNYYMDINIRPYSGVDVSQLFPGKRTVWYQWERTFMGFRPSPFNAGKMFAITVDVIRGNPSDAHNPFRWNRVQCNFPGCPTYDPSIPWCRKMFNDTPAADLEVYVDDVRPYGPTEDACHQVRTRTAQVLQYLGQQDASRKYRPPSRHPGPWCGAFMTSITDALYVYVSEEKWIKARSLLNATVEELNDTTHSPLAHLQHKPLEKTRGFLVYVCRTYPTITPYLKGLHLTLDSWRPNRDQFGWKYSGGEMPKAVDPNVNATQQSKLTENNEDEWEEEELILTRNPSGD